MSTSNGRHEVTNRTAPTIAAIGGAATVTLVAGGLVTADAVSAAPFTANSDATLRQAIDDANASPGPDTITIAAGTITLSSSLPVISGDLAIVGAGQSSTIIDGADSFRVFYADATTDLLSISSLTITNGYADSSACNGGAVLAVGTSLEINAVTMSNNDAYCYGGAIYFFYSGGGETITITDSTFTGNGAIYGGAVKGRSFNGAVTITDSTFSGNDADDRGGAIAWWERFGYVDIVIEGSTFDDNAAGTNYGGAIYIDANDGTITITDSTFSNNAAVKGGAVYIGTDGYVTISDSAFTGNVATIESAGALALSEPEKVVIERTTFTDNQSGFYGGALTVVFTDEITITDSAFANNYAPFGGGAVFNEGKYGTTTISNSTFSGNSSAADGGALMHSGPIEVLQSTFTGNSASNQGGAIAAYLDSADSIEIVNSTIAGNSALYGGGIDLVSAVQVLSVEPPAQLVVTNSVIADNVDDGGNGDIRAPFDPTLAIDHSLIEQTGLDVLGAGLNNLVDVDPVLGPLGDNGGSTPTMVPADGSPLIDAGDSTAAPFATDQRGWSRVFGAAVDIGAVEVQPDPTPSTTTTTLPSTTLPNPTSLPPSTTSDPLPAVLPPTGSDGRAGLLASALTALGVAFTLAASRRSRT